MVRAYRYSAVLVCLLSVMIFSAQVGAGLSYIQTANGNKSSKTRNLVQWTHSRLVFDQDIERIAVGQGNFMEAEILGSREVLMLAKEIGRTSVIVWYPDETTETFLFSVVEDLSILRRALTEIHPGVHLQMAPDRAALILRGTVPTVDYKVAAEAAARSYLGVGDGSTAPLIQAAVDGKGDFRVTTAGADSSGGRNSAAIINLIQVEQMPMTTKEKIELAICDIGGEKVEVTRIVRGDVPDDTLDTLLLKGEVENQVALVRVLNVAARLFLGEGSNINGSDVVEAVADEAGALIDERENNNNSNNSGISGISGGGGNYENEIKANIGRSKLLSVADGRILSMIEVSDLPLVRVSVQMYEVNRARLKDWRPDLSLVTGDYPLGGTPSPSIQSSGTEVENALQILGGVFTNHFQVGSSDLAFDLLFSLMEHEGISRTLSRPTLTVLAGEVANFQVGGEVPVPTSFAPAIGGVVVPGDGSGGTTTGGVFSGTEFKSFGVELRIRPMVGEDDRITLDVSPTVSLPDAELTTEIATTTGSDLNTTAFNTRSLQTTTRMRDGQPLVIGGLVSRQLTNNETYTPRLHNVPVLGWFTQSWNRNDKDKELIIIVTPTLVREPMENIAQWKFPTSYELLTSALGRPDMSMIPPELDPRAPELEEEEL